MQQDDGLAAEERAELERLRVEVARLRSEVQEAQAVPDAHATPTGRQSRQRWRAWAASLLIVLGCVLAPLSIVAVWTRNLVTDTDRYVATVAPLASDPAIQDAVADQITAQIFARVDVEGLTTQAVDALAEQDLNPRLVDLLRGLAGPVATGVQSFTRTQVGSVVASDAFADAWIQANRAAHEDLVNALTGEGGSITIEDDTVSINLAAFIETVKQRLLASGFSLAARIPEVNASFVLFQSDDITRASAGFNLLAVVGTWLPVLVLLVLALGVYVAKDHRRALVGAAVGVAAGMFVLALGLVVFRTLYLDGVPNDVLPRDAAAVLYDTLVRFLRLGLRTVLVLALVIAAGAFMSGPSVTAVRTRQSLIAALGWLRGSAEHAGLRTGPVGSWVYAHKRALRVAAVIASVLVLVFWDRPTGKVVLQLVAVLLVALAFIEFLGRPPPRTAPTPEPAR